MKRTVLAALADRESLPDVLTTGAFAPRFVEQPLERLAERALAPREVLVAYWQADTGDVFPDLMVVNDDDLGDTYAWLSAFAAGLAPITQWCRVLGRSQLRELIPAPERPVLGSRLGPWVGAILAECAAQARMQLNLRTLSGALASSSASFAAARAQSVWKNYSHFVELARRHDELSERLRGRTRPISAARLLSLWHAIAGDGWEGREPADARTLRLFCELFDYNGSKDLPAIERAGRTVQRVTDEFDLPELAACVTGTQRDRVEALDRLGERLRHGPKSVAVDALLGFGASLVEPGAAVMPDLLRRFETAMPTAPVWAGAFAGLWAPARVLSEHEGLGRLVAKALLSGSDLFAKPTADIAYEELARWLPSGQADRMPQVRGMSARMLDVELLPGVTAPFQLRPEPARTTPVPATRQRALELDGREASRSGVGAPSPAELAALVDALAQRVAALEAKPSRSRRSGAPRKPKE